MGAASAAESLLPPGRGCSWLCDVLGPMFNFESQYRLSLPNHDRRCLATCSDVPRTSNCPRKMKIKNRREGFFMLCSNNSMSCTEHDADAMVCLLDLESAAGWHCILTRVDHSLAAPVTLAEECTITGKSCCLFHWACLTTVWMLNDNTITDVLLSYFGLICTVGMLDDNTQLSSDGPSRCQLFVACWTRTCQIAPRHQRWTSAPC